MQLIQSLKLIWGSRPLKTASSTANEQFSDFRNSGYLQADSFISFAYILASMSILKSAH